jgi:lysophospholipase L1-like esterase
MDVKPVSRKKALLFKVLALLLPLLLLVLTEIILRLTGYGHDTRLFTEHPQLKGYWVMNRFASEKYFSDAANATFGNYEPFRQQKAAGTFRIFVLGESTTIGYPYFHNGSFHRWLQYRLVHTFPDKEFEIINVSLTAINSYTVLGFAQEIIHYSPDAVLVYTGHNEYYGALGVGSTSSIVQNPIVIKAVLKLGEFRLFQLISRGIKKFQELFSANKTDVRENLMKRMAANQQIPYGSEAYERGIKQFRSNMSDLCRLLTKNHIPLLISNLVSNERDLKPFISSANNSRPSASYLYSQAQKAYLQGNFTMAKAGFVQAREMDLLRFRAPEAMNRVLEELASAYPDVTLVKTRERFEQESPHAILGKETLLEHVHPNLYGYALLSDAFYEAIRKKRLIASRWPKELSFEELRQKMPLTAVDSLKGAYEIMILKEGWPFNEPMPPEKKQKKTIEEELAGALVVKQIGWPDAMDRLFNYYISSKNQQGALKVSESFQLEYPHNPKYYVQAGRLLMNLNENQQAVWHLRKAFQLETNFKTAQSLFVTLLKLDKPEEALIYLRYAAANNESATNLNELQAFVEQLITVRKQYNADTSNVNLSNQLAAGYLKFANTDGAMKYIEKTLKIDRSNAVALQLKGQIQAIRK